MWQHSMLMKHCSAAEMSWIQNLALRMEENIQSKYFCFSENESCEANIVISSM